MHKLLYFLFFSEKVDIHGTRLCSFFCPFSSLTYFLLYVHRLRYLYCVSKHTLLFEKPVLSAKYIAKVFCMTQPQKRLRSWYVFCGHNHMFGQQRILESTNINIQADVNFCIKLHSRKEREKTYLCISTTKTPCITDVSAF